MQISQQSVGMLIPKPLILFIDAYDSFSNNIISLLETTLNASVRTIKIDDPKLTGDELHRELRHYAAVVCGPGPGHPANDQDIGVVRRIWSLGDENTLPVLGICLGFQSLCLQHEGAVRRLKGPQHGMIRRITHAGQHQSAKQQSIFAGVGDIDATLYQSLCADIGQDTIPDNEWDTKKWEPTKQCPDIVPIAWAESDLSKYSNSGVEDARVLVGVRHATKPFWALQYHPESICTNKGSNRVFENWFTEVNRWNVFHGRDPTSFGEPFHGQIATRETLLHRSEQFRPALNGSANFPHSGYFSLDEDGSINEGEGELLYYSKRLESTGPISVSNIVEMIKGLGQDQIILESSNAYEQSVGTADVRGRYSIIALDMKSSLRFEYIARSHQITAIHPTEKGPVARHTDLRPFGGIWPFLAQYMSKRQVKVGNPNAPFWGGLMGYTTYELGLETIGVQSQGRTKQHSRPDLSLAWVTKSLVIDHVEHVAYIQEIGLRAARQHFEGWASQIQTKLQPVLSVPSLTKPTGDFTAFKVRPTIKTPKDAVYESKVRQCQEYIRSGNSYELCLTDQSTVTIPTGSSDLSWNLYKSLRARQPAPFASYIRLGSATLISSSPERFLKWNHQGQCELRPMKGTVRKSPAVNNLSAATALLDVPKEKAENLMIVDLVRHDLHGVCGSGNVQVPRLMVVEEYKSVFQMISVVQGQLPQARTDQEEKTRCTGLDVLAASLPPGSMTGAPKKRSCEILQKIEGAKERSLYSGVVGYMDVGGRGDWSVTIRSLFRWYGDPTTDTETWKIGAGGAVTALSTAVGEREEMQTKLAGTLGLFR